MHEINHGEHAAHGEKKRGIIVPPPHPRDPRVPVVSQSLPYTDLKSDLAGKGATQLNPSAIPTTRDAAYKAAPYRRVRRKEVGDRQAKRLGS